MSLRFRHSLTIALGALATTSLGGCYYGNVNGASSYAYGGNDCRARYGDTYYDYDGYAYDDGYGYDCYDAGDYGGGFVQIGFGGGWYDNYYYPGYGLWVFDSYNRRYPLRGQYLNYWGGRRAWWKHHGGRDKDWRGRDGRPGRSDGEWRGNRGEGSGEGRGGRPGRGSNNAPGTNQTGQPPVAAAPSRPSRSDAPLPRAGRAARTDPATRPDNSGPAVIRQRPPRIISESPPAGRDTGTTLQVRPGRAPGAGRAAPMPAARVAPAPVVRATPPAARATPPVAHSAPPSVSSPPPKRPAPIAQPVRRGGEGAVRED